MITGDGKYIKKINRGIILREIFKHQAISRADLSKVTGLNKATISVQVADLLKDSLILETEQVHNVVGRRPILLSIDSSAGHVLGIDLDYQRIQFTISDLGGHNVYSESVTLETNKYEDIVNLLTNHIQNFEKKWSFSRYGLISVVIGVHGTINTDEVIDFVPKYQWHHKDLKTDLNDALDMDVKIENNANLSAFAEKVYQHPASNYLLSIILTSGIGAGMMIEGVLYKGFNGFAGELGHMIILPNGEKCRCGNNGCWELYASESSLIEQLAIELKQPDLTLDDIINLIQRQDEITLKHVSTFIKHLSIGLNNVINLYNPETLVITSDILKSYPEAMTKIEKNLTSSVSQYRDIVISELSNQSAVMGACALAIQHFLEVPDLTISH